MSGNGACLNVAHSSTDELCKFVLYRFETCGACRPLVALSPHMRPNSSIDQLRIYAYLIWIAPEAAFHNILGLEPATQLHYIHCLALIGEGSVAGDHT